jgi:hypothetical protein
MPTIEGEHVKLVSLTGLEWNTLYESLIKLDKQLDDIGLEVVND